MCESLRPGITVRPSALMRLVMGPRSLKISRSLPIAVIFPAVIATASTKDGTPFVAILALYNIVSAGIKISLVQPRALSGLRPEGGNFPALGPLFLVSELYLLVSSDERWDLVFRKFRRRCAMDHGVRILQPDAVCSHVRFHDIHNCIVGVAVSPITLPLQDSGERSDRFCSSLNHSLHRVVVAKLVYVSAGIFNNIDFVAIVNRLHCRQGDAGLGPETSQDNLLAPGSFDRCDEVLVVPGIHRGPFNRLLLWKDSFYLGPNIPTEAFRLHCREHDRDVEYPGGLRQCHCVVNDRLPIEVADSEQHLRLVVNQSNHAVVRGKQAFLTEFYLAVT